MSTHVKTVASMYGVATDDLDRLEDLGGGTFRVVSGGYEFTLWGSSPRRDGSFESVECSKRAVEEADASGTIVEHDPGPEAEEDVKAFAARLGGGSRRAGERRALATVQTLLAMGVMFDPEEAGDG